MPNVVSKGNQLKDITWPIPSLQVNKWWHQDAVGKVYGSRNQETSQGKMNAAIYRHVFDNREAREDL